jgi:enoyl-CoA hydratase/carnithine racemase
MGNEPRVLTEREGPVLLITLDRVDKRNAFDLLMLQQLAEAYTELADDESLRCAVLWANGPHFTAGLDLMDVAPVLLAGEPLFADDQVDPWRKGGGKMLEKPMVIAVHGKCLTAGIELILAADVCVADETATFGQIEVARGLVPFGGATVRFVATAGWGNAMRWILTADEFEAAEAYRLGLVQEVVPVGSHVERAMELAERIASQAPLGVRATIRSARFAFAEGESAGFAAVKDEAQGLFATEDAKTGAEAVLTRRAPIFIGR